ncbi:MAG TPA: dihydrodipicolinate synthase family protein [Candidatus Limnocylindrales bacterium]|nr:dihydrodipicolinate synthase family protein [Candidatus Limnocylindrales bacterium]
MSSDARMGGVWNIVPTPFSSDGSLDEGSLRTLADFVVGTGVDGMTILGVMGEAARLSDHERSVVIGSILEAVGGRIPVCVGTSHAATDRAVAQAREAVAAGAHSIMLAPPTLARPNDAAVRRHYFAAAAAVDVPIVVQDHPASSGVWMTVEFLASLAAESHKCRVVKLEDPPTPPKIERLLHAAPELTILGGLGAVMLIEELGRGAAGTMTGFGYPEVLVDIVRRWSAGDREGATTVFDRHLPLIRFENQEGLSLAIRKHVYARRGAIATAHVRAPGGVLDEGSIAELDTILARVGVASLSNAAIS